MNQRIFVHFLVQFLTKCHYFSVSIETSYLFSWWLHLSLALFESVISSWKEYLEQNVTNVYGKPTDKREKIQRRINDPLTYLLIVYIIQELEEAIPKVQQRLGERNCEFPRLDHYISQKTTEGWHPPSLPLQSHV